MKVDTILQAWEKLNDAKVFAQRNLTKAKKKKQRSLKNIFLFFDQTKKACIIKSQF